TFAAYGRAAFFPDQAMWFERGLGAGLVLALCLVHAGRRKASGSLQIVFTVLKIVTIVAFCVFAIGLASPLQPISFWPQPGDAGSLTSAAFAVSLIYVSYAYTGWNAATYISSELGSPQRDLPRILVSGTLLVMMLYIALNAVFLLVAPIDLMVGKVEVGIIAARSAFGDIGAKLAGFVLATLLISTISAMTIAGPRVLQMIGEDIPSFKMLARTNIDGVPSRAIYLQTGISVFFVLTSSFESVLVFSGFTLAFMSFLTVGGLFILRWREPDLERPYRASFYPIPGLIYLSLTGWTLGFVLQEKPVEALLSIAFIMTGAAVYMAIKFFAKPADNTVS
ncbi:MAG: APC family permease, partial [Henriciella sp.]